MSQIDALVNCQVYNWSTERKNHNAKCQRMPFQLVKQAALLPGQMMYFYNHSQRFRLHKLSWCVGACNTSNGRISAKIITQKLQHCLLQLPQAEHAV